MPTMLDAESKKSLVRKQAFFAQLNDKELEELASLFVLQTVPAGETIVEEGNPVDSVFIIINGTADVRHVTVKDHHNVVTSLATLGPEMAIGLNETGFYSLSGVRTATVVANTEMQVLRLSVAAFHGFALANSHVNAILRKAEMENSHLAS